MGTVHDHPTTRAVLTLEFVGENYHAYRHAKRRYGDFRPVASMERDVLHAGPAHLTKPWVARITGRDATYGLAREFMEGQIDYRESNGTGSRGVYLYYALTPGIYEVNACEGWKRNRRYFVRVEAQPDNPILAAIHEMSDEEVLACLQNDTWA